MIRNNSFIIIKLLR